jgi:hypothetical protein
MKSFWLTLFEGRLRNVRGSLEGMEYGVIAESTGFLTCLGNTRHYVVYNMEKENGAGQGGDC